MVSNEWNDLHDPKINIGLKHFIHKNTISLSNDDPTMISLLLVIVQILTHVDEDSAKTVKKRVLYSTTRWRTYAHKNTEEKNETLASFITKPQNTRVD